jgi:hypothetical protein
MEQGLIIDEFPFFHLLVFVENVERNQIKSKDII